jgi:hypothetical protein
VKASSLLWKFFAQLNSFPIDFKGLRGGMDGGEADMEGAMKRKNEAGQALVFAAVGLVVLMGFAGLGIDMGMLRYQKRLQQTAADAGALAGANNLAFPASGGVTTGARGATAGNGFTDGTNNVTVTVNNPPASGPHSGKAQYVEVLVTAVQPTYFMKILGINSETLTARAVATNLSGVNSDCFYLLGPASDAGSGLNINGGGNGGISASTCGIVDSGNFASGNSANWFANTGSFAVAGSNTGGKGNVTCTSGQSPCPAYGVPAGGNPLAYLTPPAVGAPANWKNGDGPGTYSGMSFGNGNANVTLTPGVYVISGGSFSCKGNQTITGTGVMFYLTNGAVWDCSGTPSVNLTAPSTSNCGACPSQYDGILIYQDPNDKNANTMGGTTTYSLNGLVVLWGLNMKGTDTLSLQGIAGFGTSPLKNATLVE